jgi:hypothetical protein
MSAGGPDESLPYIPDGARSLPFLTAAGEKCGLKDSIFGAALAVPFLVPTADDGKSIHDISGSVLGAWGGCV